MAGKSRIDERKTETGQHFALHFQVQVVRQQYSHL